MRTRLILPARAYRRVRSVQGSLRSNILSRLRFSRMK